MIKNDKTNIDEKYKRFEKNHDKIKFKAFGKVTIRQRRIPKDKLEVVGKDTATELLEAQQQSCRTGKCCNSKFSRTAVRWDTNIEMTQNTLCYGIYGSSRKNPNILARKHDWVISKWVNI